MRLLLLGGTAWLGRSIAACAVRRGHEVVCLARGESGAVPEGAVLLEADRDGPGAYDQVARQRWDAVLDVSRQPGQVRRAAHALADRTGTFVFVSSASVYAETHVAGQDENGPLLPTLAGDVMESMEDYGSAKVACEQHALTAFGADRTLVARVGLIAGPGDASDRTGYWPLRFSRPASSSGAVLVPAAPELSTQVIDVRDLAGWLVECAERGQVGIFNVTGDAVPFPDHLAAARQVAGHTGPLVEVDGDWLTEHGVQPWMGPRSLPLWLPVPEYAGFGSRDNSAARAAGLVSRPLTETLADTLAWELGREPGRARSAGLSDQEERELLDLAGRA